MKFLSTFTGIGGFEVGIQTAWKMLGIADEPEFIGFSEINKFAASVYSEHYKGVRNYGDITKINADELPDFDCLVGGFPCQAFSIAGKRGGFNDTRGTLFFDLARILKSKRPRLFVFENVKGLLSHDGGRTFDTIIRTIDELGYDCQWQVLNSKNHGVPQNRERIVIVGHLRGKSRPQVFPFTESGGEADELHGDYANTLTARYGAAETTGSYIIESELNAEIKQINQPKHSNDRVYDAGGISPTLNTMQGGNRQPFVRVPEATKKGYAEATVGQAINLSIPTSKTRRGRVSDISPTLQTSPQIHTLDTIRERKKDALGRNMPVHRLRHGIRKLTPIECERLQGFPDNWTQYGLGGGTY